MVSRSPSIILNDSHTMPQLGLGVWQADDEETEEIVRFALDDAGYRSIDTATDYGNEAGVGRGLAVSDVDRDDVFITTKLWNAEHGRVNTLAAVDTSLALLGLDHLDLYLIHWPLVGHEDRLVETWATMIEIQRAGKARSIGVSNFEPHHLDLLAAHTDVVPAVNQVELHPLLQQRELRGYCAERGITVEAWSPLGGSGKGWGGEPHTNQLLGNPTLAVIAEKHDKSIAQVIIRWHLQSGIVVIPKSSRTARVAQNADVFDFALDDEDMAVIDGLDAGRRFGAHPDELNFDAPAS